MRYNFSQINAHWSQCMEHLVLRDVRGWDLQVRGLHAPDVPCILSDGPVTGELARAGDVPDDLFGPLCGVL
jgi:hypothetical protein